MSTSNIPNEPGNRPARDYDRHIDRPNAGESVNIAEPEDAEFIADLVEGLRELATEAQTASAAVSEFGRAVKPYAEDDTVPCPKCNMACKLSVESDEKPDGSLLGYSVAECEYCGHDLTEDEIYMERKA